MLTDGSLQLTVQADEKLLGQMRQRQVQGGNIKSSLGEDDILLKCSKALILRTGMYNSPLRTVCRSREHVVALNPMSGSKTN
jgi:hypothetical protein